MGLHYIKKLLSSKGNNDHSEETAYRIGCFPAIHVTGNFVSRICYNKSISKWENELNRHFSEKAPKINKCIKKCSISLTIKEMQIKNTLRVYLIPVRMANHQDNKQQMQMRMWEKGTPIHF
jgi:hypothetical protein